MAESKCLKYIEKNLKKNKRKNIAYVETNLWMIANISLEMRTKYNRMSILRAKRKIEKNTIHLILALTYLY